MDITTLVSVCTREDALVLAVTARDRAVGVTPLRQTATAIARGPAAARKAVVEAGLAVRKLPLVLPRQPEKLPWGAQSN
jgi:hypothetical protein